MIEAKAATPHRPTGRPPFFCFTLDTEPDDLWRSTGELRFEHFKRLRRFHQELSERGARPVYLTTSEVIENPASRQVMAEILATGTAEVGAHFHTWTRSWPFEVPSLGDPPLQAMAHQLPAHVEAQMLAFTCDAIEAGLGVRPLSYRGGRWSLGSNSVAAMVAAGIRVDSSVTPGLTWQQEGDRLIDGPDYRGFPCSPFFLRDGPIGTHESGPVLEIPVGAAHVVEGGMGPLLRRLTSVAFGRKPTHRLRDWTWLRPTTVSTPMMRLCLESLQRAQAPVWVAMIHSSEVVRNFHLHTEGEVASFMERCFTLVTDAQRLGAVPATLAEVAAFYGVGR